MADISESMRRDWNLRAREDANYYAAYGRRGQSDDDFLASAGPVVRNLEKELRRILRETDPQTRRALEIGCGPGRLMIPMSRHFSEIHGVDVSDEMIRLAEERLRDIPHAHVYLNDGTDLAGFADQSFDFVYSYAVFQHIPSREVVLSYLRESQRVLKAGGLLRCHLNGLPKSAGRHDTWHGAKISAADVIEFARKHDFQLLAVEGASTQYMWITARKAARRLDPAPAEAAQIRRISNAYSSEPVAPCRGRSASISLWVEGLPSDCDIVDLAATIAGVKSPAFYVGPVENDGLQQVNASLPAFIGTGLHPVRLWWLDRPISREATLRVVPPGPTVPRLISVTDGINLLAGPKIVSGILKVILEEVERPEELRVFLEGREVAMEEILCVDPVPPRYEINLRLPGSTEPGTHLLEMRIGHRRFAPVQIEISPQQEAPFR